MAGDASGTAHENQAPSGAPPALALYRRYRPATFAEVKGQEHVTEPLRQALRNGRVHHAYLFSGPRGCGKTSSARILARSLNCVQGPTPDPCGVCDSCVALAPSGPGSIDVIEIDAASHGGVDDARDLRERAFYAPVSGRFKVYIIDEAHMVTREGFNALLKLVEEPPPHLKFVFATTEPEKVIATIRSRTHHYPFRLVPPAVLRALLEEILAAEQVRYEPSVLPLVVRAGAGSVRDSLSVLDQLIAGAGDEGLVYDRTVALLGYSDDTLLDDMVAAFAAGDGAAAFGTVDRVVQSGHDPRRFAADLLDRLRDLIILAAVPGAGKAGLLDAPADRLERMADQAERFGQAGLARAAEIFSEGLIQMRGTTSPRLLLELMCAQVLLPGAGTGEKALLARLERLEHRLATGAGAETSEGPPGPSGAGGGRVSEPRGVKADPEEAQRDGPHTEPGDAGAGEAAAVPAGHAGGGERTAVAGQGGEAGLETLRQRWPDVLEAVRGERRLAWIQLRSADVQGLEGNVLTVGFGSEGVAKGFSTSGCDQVLAGVLSTMLGLNVRVKAIVGTVSPPPASEAPSAPATSGDAVPDPAPAASPQDVPHGRVSAPRQNAPGAGAQARPPRPPADDAPRGKASAAPRPRGERGAGGRRGPSGRGATPPARPDPGPATGEAQPRGQAAGAGGSAFGDEEWPDDAAGEDVGGAEGEGLTGMELIQRQLGGRVIQEIEEA
jgi:DNA polymerase III subunit gamma/tau